MAHAYDGLEIDESAYSHQTMENLTQVYQELITLPNNPRLSTERILIMQQRTFPCPRCGKPATWENNEFRPFCSERCKMIDLGAWANEEYRVPTQDSPSRQDSSFEDD